MTEITYRPQGVCSNYIKVQIEEDGQSLEDNHVKRVLFLGGCPGNSLGLAKVLEGMKVKEVIEHLEGVRCGAKSTSCPDQLAQALKDYINGKGE